MRQALPAPDNTLAGSLSTTCHIRSTLEPATSRRGIAVVRLRVNRARFLVVRCLRLLFHNHRSVPPGRRTTSSSTCSTRSAQAPALAVVAQPVPAVCKCMAQVHLRPACPWVRHRTAHTTSIRAWDLQRVWGHRTWCRHRLCQRLRPLVAAHRRHLKPGRQGHH